LKGPVLGAAVALLAGCASPGGPGQAPPAGDGDRLGIYARLLSAEDSRSPDADLFARAASSRDPWIRAKTALACGRVKDPDAGPILEVLLRDADPAVQRAAAFGAGLTGDRNLVPLLAPALDDPDGVTAADAADALGKLGGAEATGALLAAAGRPGRSRGAAALALHRVGEPRVLEALAAVALGPGVRADVRRAAVYSMARRPKSESLPALRAVLRKDETDEDPDSLAWAARAAGLLADAKAVPDLVRLSASTSISVAVQSLLALEKISSSSRETAAFPSVRTAALRRAGDPVPGVAVAALRLLGRVKGDAEVLRALEENLRRKGWRGQAALVSMARLEGPDSPERVQSLLADAVASDSLEAKLGACETLEFVGDLAVESAGARLLLDGSACVRAAALASLSKRKAPVPLPWLHAALRDPSPSVRAAALEAAAPLVDGPAAPLLPAWSEAFERSFDSAEPDDVVSALDAAASRGEKGRALVAARVDDREPVVRGKARRLMVETYGAARGSFRRMPVATGRTTEDYLTLARMAMTTRAEAEIETSSGAFTVELDFEEAPLTSHQFMSLARRGFFEGLLIHRVVPDFVVQTGDPRGDGTGGPGTSIRDEINPLRYVRGAVGMALSGPDTGGSQWFVALSPQPHLDGGYTVFGKVTSGGAVLDRIEQNDRLVSVRIRERPVSKTAEAAR